MLEELGLPYELKVWPFPPRVHAREYLELNQLGTVPLMVDKGVKMTESAAICQYLCALSRPTTLDVGPEEAAFGSFLNWMHFGEATLTFPQTLVLRYSRFEPVLRRNNQVTEDYSRWYLARLRAVDEALKSGDFLCAGRFTAADVSVGYALMLGGYLGFEAQYPAAVLGYWERLQSRPAFQRALVAQQEAAQEQGVSTVPAPHAGGQ